MLCFRTFFSCTKLHFKMPHGGMPDRWEKYINPLGEKIPGTRFIPFKSTFASEEEQFTPASLLRLLEERGIGLGQVIDLTQTDRYYNPKEFRSNNIEHLKITTRGHVVPDRRTCNRFAMAVDRFLEDNKENDLLIGVHCTHGVNRTGFLVCRYMIDKLDIQPENAIEAFNTARGYNIERENYLHALRTGKSGDNQSDEDDHINYRPRGGANPRDRRNRHDYSNSMPPHGYQGHKGYHRQYHQWNGASDRTINESYNPGYTGGHAYGRPRNPHHNWSNGYHGRPFGHPQDSYPSGNMHSAPFPPPSHHQHRQRPNGQWNGTFNSHSRHSSSSYSWPPQNEQYSHGDRNYGRSWSSPSKGHRGSTGKSHRRFNPYASYT